MTTVFYPQPQSAFDFSASGKKWQSLCILCDWFCCFEAFLFLFFKSLYIKVGNSPTHVSARPPGSKKIFLVLSFSFVLGKNKKSE